MTKNWKRVCQVLNGKQTFNFLDEVKTLQVIDKNIYHKKPMSVPVQFEQV